MNLGYKTPDYSGGLTSEPPEDAKTTTSYPRVSLHGAAAKALMAGGCAPGDKKHGTLKFRVIEVTDRVKEGNGAPMGYDGPRVEIELNGLDIEGYHDKPAKEESAEEAVDNYRRRKESGEEDEEMM